MSDFFDHSWTEHCRRRLQETSLAAAAVLIDVEAHAMIWTSDMWMLDKAIADLKAAKALHLARLAEYDKKDAA